MYIGQDPGYWIANGYVQSIQPMCYGDWSWSNSTIGWETYSTGGAHGECSLVFSLTDGATDPTPEAWPTADWVMMVQSVLSAGADGWQLWSYGGPAEASCPYTSVVPYLQALEVAGPPCSSSAFTMGSIAASSVSSTSEQVSWQTSSVANSTVEYSIYPLFTSSTNSTYYPWNFTQVTYNAGTIVTSSATVTSHSITLTGLTPGTTYYFRVQSQDPSGTATSKVSTFTTG
jgi:hypothetical protein